MEKDSRNRDRNNSHPHKMLSIPMVLVSREAETKIAKLNDTINLEKSQFTRDPQTKQYKITEKKTNKQEIKYTGSHMAEQSSKYLLFKFNSETGKIEVSPAGDWHDFKREINFPTFSIEEAEEKMKGKSGLIDYLRNKGGPATKSKTKKAKDEFTINISTKKSNAVEEEEDFQNFQAPVIESASEEDKEELDLDLKEAPSDIEEDFIKGKKTKEDNKLEGLGFTSEEDDNQDENEDLFEDDEDDLDGDNFSDVDSEALIDKIDADEANFGKEFINVKRKGDENIYDQRPGEKKQRTGNYDLIPRMEEALLHTLSKNKKITQPNIVKELLKLNFSKNEIDTHLNTLLARFCEKFQQGNEYFYFKKSEK
jgi:hypothetical protein